MNIKDISLPTFIWYILPGINTILFLFILPISVFNFQFIEKNISTGTALGFLFAGLIVGFLMDSAKLYQLTPRYKINKSCFFYELSTIVSGPKKATIENGKEIFRFTRLYLSIKGKGFPLWEHSRWVMVNHTSKASFFASIIWTYMLIKNWQIQLTIINYKTSIFNSRLVIAIIAIVFLLLGYRLYKESLKILKEANQIYLTYVKMHLKEISVYLSENNS